MNLSLVVYLFVSTSSISRTTTTVVRRHIIIIRGISEMCVGRDRSWHHSFHRYRRRVSHCHKSQHHGHRRRRRFDRFVALQLLTTS